MIELEQETPVPSESISVEALYELLQPYYGRVVRASTVDSSSSALTIRLGRIQGIFLKGVDTAADGVPPLLRYIYLVIEGQGEMLLVRRTSSIEVLQENSGKWVQIYRGSESIEAKRAAAA